MKRDDEEGGRRKDGRGMEEDEGGGMKEGWRRWRDGE